jgi:hypothetical protein
MMLLLNILFGNSTLQNSIYLFSQFVISQPQFAGFNHSLASMHRAPLKPSKSRFKAAQELLLLIRKNLYFIRPHRAAVREFILLLYHSYLNRAEMLCPFFQLA